MMTAVKRKLETILMSLAGMLPARVMAHVMFLLRGRPGITDRWGFHIRAMHYYEPLPDFRNVTSDALKRKRHSPAIDFRAEGQIRLLQRLSENYSQELAEIAKAPSQAGYDFSNTYFAGMDAAAYYALIRDLSPALVVEIGSGFSTQIASKALARNAEAGRPGRLVCIEPFPEPRLMQSGAQFTLLQTPVQDVPLDFFDQLTGNDILFIDSSHVATVGSDVCAEILDILPRLNKGVWVHVHDIFFPTDYPAEWVIEKRIAFNEQYILEAFLAFNSAYSVQLANAWVWREANDTARLLCPSGSPHPGHSPVPASFWMRRDK